MGARHDQHFLIDPTAVARIVGAYPVEGRDVLEIGPGRGVLTAALLEAGARVTAIEYDRQLVEHLGTRFATEIAAGSLSLIQGDAARCPWPEFELMVANLPYSISSPVVFRLLESPYEAAVLMFQREFAATDVVLSKGQGNFESLNEVTKENLFFLFTAKCDSVCVEAGVPKRSIVCMKHRNP